MLEIKLLQVGLLLHLAVQIYIGFKTKKMNPNMKILGLSIFIFSLAGSILTIINFYSNVDFGECGTKIFNPIIIISLWGSLLNPVVYLVSYIFLRVSQFIKSSITKNTSM